MYVNEMTELMNICMIYDNHGNVLLQNRRKKNWAGVAFPGGHVEKGEALVPSVIREIKEETGLDIKNVKLCGVKEWFKEGVRCMVFFYKTNCFQERCSPLRKVRYFGRRQIRFQNIPWQMTLRIIWNCFIQKKSANCFTEQMKHAF